MDKYSCIDCAAISCDRCNDRHPKFCVSKNTDPELLKEAMEEYKLAEVNKAMRAGLSRRFSAPMALKS